MNYLYCFDKNYNIQGINSINTLFMHSKSKICIYIIHEEPNSIIKDLNDLKNQTLHEIKIFKYKKQHIKFPRVEGTHVSDATYYRLFLTDYLPDDLDYITYIDADILCLKDPNEVVSETIKNMNTFKNPLAAVTESVSDLENINRLGLKQNKYFNAGVLIINLNIWNEKNNTNLFINNMNKIRDKILWWDQDVLNFTFDGDYFEMNPLLNYQIEPNKNFDTKKIENEVIFLHYLGNTKPWSFKGFENNYSKYYQQNFRFLNRNKYHLVSKNLKQDTLKFFNILINEITSIEFKISFISVSLVALITNFMYQIKRKILKI